MEKFAFLICVASATTVVLPWSFRKYEQPKDASHICIHSSDPAKYTPKCFMCLNAVYPFALRACVNRSSMPANITFEQANCFERNCAINYPGAADSPSLYSLWFKKGKWKRSADDTFEDDLLQNSLVPQDIYEDFKNQVLLTKSDIINDDRYYITNEEETFASDDDDDDDDQLEEAEDYRSI